MDQAADITNILDRIVAAFSPRAGLQRTQARLHLHMVRKYAAAEVNRNTQGWKASSGTSSAEVFGSLSYLRNRSRQMVRDNEHLKKAVRTWATHIVGTGIVVDPQDAAEREDWQRWSDGECDATGELDLAGLCRLGVHAWKEGGEYLVRRRWRRLDDGFVVPMQLQLLEPDHLDENRTGLDANGNINIMGVQYNALGRRAGYWLFDDHPGEIIGARRNLQSRFVPASDVLHIYSKDRISQVRGVPELAVSLMRTRDLADYAAAERVRKKIEACFVMGVTTDDPRTTVGGVDKGADGRTVEKMSPGMIKYFKSGESVSFGTPAAVGGFGEYNATELHAIAAGTGVTYQQLTGDTSRTNYTGHRAALREFYALVDAEQWLTFIPMFVRPVRRWYREAALLAGRKVGNKPDAITTPMKQMVDPLKDTLADQAEVLAGFATLSEKLRARGISFDKWLAEKVKERDALAQKGIVLSSDAAVAELGLTVKDVLNADGSAGSGANNTNAGA